MALMPNSKSHMVNIIEPKKPENVMPCLKDSSFYRLDSDHFNK